MRIVLDEIVPVFAHARRLLRHIVNIAIIRVALMEKFRPRDPIANRQQIAAHVMGDLIPQLVYHPDYFMPENARARIRTMSLIGVDIRPADRRHGDANQRFFGFDVAHGIFPHHERRVWRVINDSAAHSCHDRCLVTLPAGQPGLARRGQQ